MIQKGIITITARLNAAQAEAELKSLGEIASRIVGEYQRVAETHSRTTGDAAQIHRNLQGRMNQAAITTPATKGKGIQREHEGLRSLAAFRTQEQLFNAAVNSVKSGIQGNSNLEQATTMFTSLFRDADRAQAKIAELYEFAAKTPFEFGAVKDAALTLETFGLDSSNYLRDAGDLAAAFGAEISEVARAFGDINSGDFDEAFKALRDFGINRKDLEGEGLVFDKSGNYQGSVDQALTAVQNIIRAKFGGMMEEQSKTFEGQVNTLANNAQMLLTTAFSAPFDTIRDKVAELNQSLDGDFGDRLDNLAALFGDNLHNSLLGIIPIAEAFGRILLVSAEKANEVVGGVGVLAAKFGGESARKDLLKSGLSGAFSQLDAERLFSAATNAKGDLGVASDQATQLGFNGSQVAKFIAILRQVDEGISKAVDQQIEESFKTQISRIKTPLKPRNTVNSGGRSGGATVTPPKSPPPKSSPSTPSSPEVVLPLTNSVESLTTGRASALEDYEKAKGGYENALRSGLQAGLDGGIPGLIGALESGSKSALANGIAAAITESTSKELMTQLGAAFANPVVAAFGMLFSMALERFIEERKQWDTLRDRYITKESERPQWHRDLDTVNEKRAGIETRLGQLDGIIESKYTHFLDRQYAEGERDQLLQQLTKIDELTAGINREAAEEQRKAAEEQRRAANQAWQAFRDAHDNVAGVTRELDWEKRLEAAHGTNSYEEVRDQVEKERGIFGRIRTFESSLAAITAGTKGIIPWADGEVPQWAVDQFSSLAQKFAGDGAFTEDERQALFASYGEDNLFTHTMNVGLGESLLQAIQNLADGIALEGNRVLPGSSPQNPNYTIVLNQKDIWAFAPKEAFLRSGAPGTRRDDPTRGINVGGGR